MAQQAPSTPSEIPSHRPKEAPKNDKTTFPQALQKLSLHVGASLLATLGAAHFEAKAALPEQHAMAAETNTDIQQQVKEALYTEAAAFPKESQTILQVIGDLSTLSNGKPVSEDFISRLQYALTLTQLKVHSAYLQQFLYSKLIIERDTAAEQQHPNTNHRVYTITTDLPFYLTIRVKDSTIVIDSKKYADIQGDLGETLEDKLEITHVRAREKN